ncbi:MAG: SOS response-associated peptidase [Dehalococcoidia bacterium]|nr:SOS response-associated peptidase [Dehalococcoidia bacterium]
MCGRFTLTLQGSMIADWFEFEPGQIDLAPRYNIAPSQDVLTIIRRDVGNQPQFMRWGLIPFWAKDMSIGYKMINARAETVAESRAFKSAFQKRRCLIPADSFYEWQGAGKSKRPLRIMLKSEEPFAFPGIWETWKDKSNPASVPVLSCSIITTVPNSFMEPIHDRMPVILPRAMEQVWLDPGNEDLGMLREMLLPCDPGLLKAYEVSALVNSPKNYGSEVILPVTAPFK